MLHNSLNHEIGYVLYRQLEDSLVSELDLTTEHIQTGNLMRLIREHITFRVEFYAEIGILYYEFTPT